MLAAPSWGVRGNRCGIVVFGLAISEESIKLRTDSKPAVNEGTSSCETAAAKRARSSDSRDMLHDASQLPSSPSAGVQVSAWNTVKRAVSVAKTVKLKPRVLKAASAFHHFSQTLTMGALL